MKRLLFVYGTLMRSERNAAELGAARFLRDARSAPHYTLVDLGGFPALLPGGSTAITGELFEVDETALPALDAFEEDHQLAFRRRAISLSDGTAADAYFFLAPTSAPVIPTGDWRRR